MAHFGVKVHGLITTFGRLHFGLLDDQEKSEIDINQYFVLIKIIVYFLFFISWRYLKLGNAILNFN